GVLAFAGSYAPPKRAGKYKGGGVGPSPCYSYTACVVELSVDEDTGEVELHDVWIGHDIGRALNPLLVEGQVEGSVYMGIGEAVMEAQVFRQHGHKAPSMLEHKRQGKAARVGPDRVPLFTFKQPLVVESAFGAPAEAIAVRPFSDTPS